MRSILLLVLVLGCSKARDAAPTAIQVPADTALVGRLSLERLRATSHWPKIESALSTKIPLAEIQKTCTIDPTRTIQSFTLALPDDLAPQRALVFMRGVPRDVVDSCAKSFAAAQNHRIEIRDEDKLAAYREGDDAIVAAWLDAKTVAFGPGDLAARDRLQALYTPAQHPPALADVLAKLRHDRVLAFGFHAPAQSTLALAIADLGIEPNSGYGWLDLGTTLEAEVVTRYATPEKAAAAAKQTFIGPLAKLQSTLRDREVVFSLKLDANETAQLIDELLAAAR